MANALSQYDKVYFIRHKQDDKQRQLIKDVMDQKRIAIMFEDMPWPDVFDSTTGQPSHKIKNKAYKSAINYFHQLSQNGGYLVVEYLNGEIPNGGYGAIVSRVKKGTPVEETKEYKVTLRLDDTFYKYFYYNEYPVLLAIRPPYGTICVPSRNTYREFVNYKLTGKKPKPSTDLMHPKMVEQMCVEYLIKEGVNGNKLNYCILRPGNNLAIIDICGVLDNDIMVFAQVKNEEISDSQLKMFDDFIDINTVNIIFSKDKNRKYKGKNIIFKNIDDIFAYFYGKNPKMLEKMAGF